MIISTLLLQMLTGNQFSLVGLTQRCVCVCAQVYVKQRYRSLWVRCWSGGVGGSSGLMSAYVGNVESFLYEL